MLEPEVVVYEPRVALFAGDDGLSAFCQLAPDVYRLLNLDGVAVLECGLGQVASLIEIFSGAGLNHLATLYIICNTVSIRRRLYFPDIEAKLSKSIH